MYSAVQGEARLSLVTNEKGGIIDDTVITRYDKFMCARMCISL